MTTVTANSLSVQPATAGAAVAARWERVGLAVLLLAVVAAWLAVALAPIELVSLHTTDDAYYYFQVARNLAAGHGVTFDGVSLTNGFHPLWMLCLWPVYALFGGEPELALRAVYFVIVALVGATIAVTYRCLSAFAGRRAAVAGLAALSAPFLVNPLINGLETGLLTLLLVAALLVDRRCDLLRPDSSTRTNLLLGLLLALIVLCRLDLVFVGFAVAGLIAWRTWAGEPGAATAGASRRIGTLLRKYVQVGVVGVVLVTPYLAWNLLTFGHLTPISGALKSSFPVVSLSAAKFEPFAIRLALLEYGLATFVVLWLTLLPRRGPAKATDHADETAQLNARGPGSLLVALWLGCGLHLVNTLLFMNWAVHWWHFASYAPLALLAGVLLIARLEQTWRAQRWLAPVAGILLLAASAGAWTLDAHRRGAHHGPWYAAARWIDAELPDGAVLAMEDCGLVGYFCGRPMVNLDGVINGYAFQKALATGTLSDYLQHCGVTHIADYEVRYRDGEYRVRLPDRLTRAGAAILTATPAAEVYGSAPYADAEHREGGIHFAIWDLRQLTLTAEPAPKKEQ